MQYITQHLINRTEPYSRHCRFTGYLAADPQGSCVAMTGCPGGDEDVELTVLSVKFGNRMLKWKADGSVEETVSPAGLNIILQGGSVLIDYLLLTHICNVQSAIWLLLSYCTCPPWCPVGKQQFRPN